MKQLGYREEDFTGRPVVAIINTWSEINPCHAHLRERAEAVKKGVWQAGGFPVEIPAFSITETYMKPSPMLYRNLLAMETEENLRSLPVDGAVLMGGCDKTTPGLLMGAISMTCRLSTFLLDLCCVGIGKDSRSAAAPIFGSSGRNVAPVPSPNKNGTTWRVELRALLGFA